MDSTLIMGRLTWESIGQKPLPGRRNVVITSRAIEGAEAFPDIASALATCSGPVWFIGGARIYADAMRYADVLDVTTVPDHVEAPDAVRFPRIDPAVWEEGPEIAHEDEPALRRREFTRKAAQGVSLKRDPPK
jgi:dihydrofolate reductase